MTDELISAPSGVVDTLNSIIFQTGISKQLYPEHGKSYYEEIIKIAQQAVQPSGQGVALGRKAHPFDMEAVCRFQTANVHHATCIHTFVAAAVGLGFETAGQKKKRAMRERMEVGQPPENADGLVSEDFETSAVDDALNPLCDESFAEVLSDVAEDYKQSGNGFMEIVRAEGRPNSPITGIHHLPAKDTYVFIEDDLYNRHYEIVNGEGRGGTKHFARFGDLESFLQRGQAGNSGFFLPAGDEAGVSEVIHFRRPSSLSRWYGYPDWLASVAAIELVQCLLQHKFDFFLNRGVPEFFLWVLGQKLDKDDWKKIETALKANIGLGNAHKSVAMNLANENIKVQLDKLAVEGGDTDEFEKIKEALSLDIVSAHRVPPLLAGIQIPGKLGATNELPNALMAFQVLVCGPAQRLFQQKLGQTLGNPAVNGGLSLTMKDFTFNKITDQIDLKTMDTVGRMRQTVPQAQAEGRNIDDGLKD